MAGVAIVLVFGGIIIIHELGHFLMAKRAGVQVDEFAIGFGPRLAGYRRGDTDYTLRLLPLGGFVRMAGMFPEEEGEGRHVAPGRGFNDQPVGRRMGIVAAGPVMNLILAAALLTVALAAIGTPKPTLTVDALEEGKPAAVAGVQPDDRISAVNGRSVADWNEFRRLVGENPGRELQLELQRGSRSLVVNLIPADVDGRGFAGISPVVDNQKVPWLSAVPEGIIVTIRFLGLIIVGLAGVIAGQGAADLIGPIGIASEIGNASRVGLYYLLTLAAIISVNLGLLNLLPFPALDGSRLVFLSIEAARGRPVDPRKENWVHAVGFALLIFLLLMVTYRDILRLHMG